MNFSDQQKKEIRDLVYEGIDDYFATKGKSVKGLLIATATVVGSLTVIFGGFKIVLGWIGFTIINK